MKRVLVTGGSGFIGRRWCEWMEEQGVAVSNLDLIAPEWLPPGSRDLRGDVRNAAAVRAAMEGCDAVLHLAAAHHDFGIKTATYFDVNEGGARVITEEMDRAGVREVCFYSSVAVYGAAPEPRTEETQPRPESPYGASKLAGEEVFRAWTGIGDGRRALIIRPTAVCGPRNFANVFALMRQIDSGWYLPIGRGDNVKSLAYVGNLVEATAFLWQRRDAPMFDVFNYVDKPDLTSHGICEVIAASVGRRPVRWSIPLGVALAFAAPFGLISRLSGKNLPISAARVRKLAQARSCFAADKVRAAGFVASTSLPDGLSQMGAWFRAAGRSAPVVSHLPPEHVGHPPARAGRAAEA